MKRLHRLTGRVCFPLGLIESEGRELEKRMDLGNWGDLGLIGLRNLGYGIHYPIRHGQIDNWVRRTSWQLLKILSRVYLTKYLTGPNGTFLAKLYF